MESTLTYWLNGFLHPVVAAIVVGALSYVMYLYCSNLHNGAKAKSDFELASMNGTKHTIAAVFLVALSLYALIHTAYVIFAGFLDQGASAVLYHYTEVRFNGDLMYNAIFALGAVQFTYASIISCLRIINITALMHEARNRLLLTYHPAAASEHVPRGQSESTAPEGSASAEDDSVEEPSEAALSQRTEPVTYTDILQSLQQQLIDAMKEAQELRNELDETREKVVVLEDQVQAKDEWIQEIESGTASFRDHLNANEASEDDGKRLNLTDSVMVGDSIMGGVKIDKQINNDPDAIARAVMEAYRAGRDERED